MLSIKPYRVYQNYTYFQPQLLLRTNQNLISKSKGLEEINGAITYGTQIWPKRRLNDRD